MSALTDFILDEVLRHEQVVGPYFNLRCKCGHIETTVSRLGDFERHVSVELEGALTGAGLIDTAALEKAGPAEARP